MILNFGEAPSIRKAELGALYTPKSDKDDSSPEAEKILGIWDLSNNDHLSPYHDSQFSAFSTEVLVRKNRDTIAVVLPALP